MSLPFSAPVITTVRRNFSTGEAGGLGDALSDASGDGDTSDEVEGDGEPFAIGSLARGVRSTAIRSTAHATAAPATTLRTRGVFIRAVYPSRAAGTMLVRDIRSGAIGLFQAGDGDPKN
jgi:hypothetical protein